MTDEETIVCLVTIGNDLQMNSADPTEQLKAWAMMDDDTVQTVIASNFMRNFRTVKKREEEYQQIPSEIRTLLEQERQKTLALEKGK